MSKKVAIVTDSTAYLTEEVRKKLHIHVVPLSVIFGDDVYEEEIEISTEQFYKKLAANDKLPTTSQPAIGRFVELFMKLAEEGYHEVVTIHLSSKISGTYQGALRAGDMVEGIDVYGFDSGISCAPQGYFVEKAAKLALDGVDAKTIIQQLEKMRPSIKAYFMVADLKHLHRGGRLGSGQLVVGQLLKIKPVLHFDDGVIVPFEKIRTEKKAIARILSLLEQDVEQGGLYTVTVIHTLNEEQGQSVATSIRERFTNVDVDISYFGPVIGTHLGEGSLGIVWYKRSE